MKENQIVRIKEFVDSLENKQMQDKQQALVLQTEFSVIGGDNESCTNSGRNACLDRNGTCTNSANCGYKNGTCSNGPGPIGPAGPQ